MLQILYGEVPLEDLLQLGRQMKTQHFNAIMALLLCRVIRDNKMLQHFDLSSTHLPAWVISHIAKRLKKSGSLLSLHLTDNPGLHKEGIKDEIHAMLKCKPTEKKNYINIREMEQKAFRKPSVLRLQT